MARAPYIDDPDFTLWVGDVREVLADLEPGSVDCCVTSPPYWNLRDYGTDGQIGLEATPALFVAEMVAVFQQVHRVLADHGTLWLNLGDSYNAYNGNRGETGSTLEGRRQNDVGRPKVPSGSGLTAPGLKPKDLVGIPWRVAFALQDDGWYLRSDIIWAKKNCMPESVTDRPTKQHEYVFLLAKQPRYYFDQEAVREAHKPDGRHATRLPVGQHSHENHAARNGQERWPNGGRNMRTVWEIATEAYADAHFATFPQEIPRRAIRAGCPERVCLTCGKPSERIVEKPGGSFHDHDQGQSQGGSARKRQYNENLSKPRGTVGWTDCGHDNWRPGRVIDPFMGSGTTALVARQEGRHAVGVDLSEEYARLCETRTQQLRLA